MKYSASQIRKAIGAAGSAVVAIALVFGTDINEPVNQVVLAANELVGIALVFKLVNDE